MHYAMRIETHERADSLLILLSGNNECRMCHYLGEFGRKSNRANCCRPNGIILDIA